MPEVETGVVGYTTSLCGADAGAGAGNGLRVRAAARGRVGLTLGAARETTMGGKTRAWGEA
jgi:hypothetical protein